MKKRFVTLYNYYNYAEEKFYFGRLLCVHNWFSQVSIKLNPKVLSIEIYQFIVHNYFLL